MLHTGKDLEDFHGFFDTILEEPDDDTPRLVFADWLDEHNDSLGRFIRVQIELDRIAHRPEEYIWHIKGGKPTQEENEELRSKLLELFQTENAIYDARILPMKKGFTDHFFNYALPEKIKLIYQSIPAYSRYFSFRDNTIVYRRGFGHTVNTSLSFWMELGYMVCSEHPIRTVLLADRAPGVEYICDDEFYYWQFAEDDSRQLMYQEFLPESLRFHMEGYRQHGHPRRIHYGGFNQAVVELQKACLREARQKRLTRKELGLLSPEWFQSREEE